MVGNHTLLYEELTAEENLIFFFKLFGLSDPAAMARPRRSNPLASRVAPQTWCAHSRAAYGSILSIARALLASPGLLLLDEAGTGLDPEGQQWLGATIKTLCDAGCTNSDEHSRTK